MLQSALLGVLEARPMSGYELARFFDAASGWLWSAPQSQIYPTLRRMEAAGLIAGEQRKRGRLERTVYRLTDDGRSELMEWLSEAHPAPPMRDAFALQAVLIDLLPPDDARTVLKAYVAQQESAADRFAHHRDRLLRRDTELLRERLRSRPPAEHDRIARLKAHVFDGQSEVARIRAEWGTRAISLLDEDGR